MKHLSVYLLTIVLLFGCSKDRHVAISHEPYANVLRLLMDSLPPDAYRRLDFNAKAVYQTGDKAYLFMRIPVRGENFNETFLLCKFPSNQSIVTGRWVHIEGDTAAYAGRGWNGHIVVRSMQGQELVNSPVKGGYIASEHGNLREETMASMLPEVIVVSYLNSDSYMYATWLLFDALMYSGGGGSGSTSYGQVSHGGGSSGGGSANGGYPAITDLYEFDLEYIYAKPSIDITKYLACFDNVSSAGAVYSIKLCADIPANSDPTASSSNSVFSAGHTFITLTKSNGTAAVTQSFGFYPQTEPSIMNPFAAVPSTLKDNGANEYNASIEMKITEGQFNTIRQKAGEWAVNTYTITTYNCTNYGVGLFNLSRTNPITMAPYTVVLPGYNNPYSPGSNNTNVVNIAMSPQMLFVQLQAMKAAGGADAASIVIDQSNNSAAPASKGACN